MQGRDLGQCVELVLIIRTSKIRGPRVTHGVTMEAEHVHDADCSNAGTIQIGTLIQTGADQQTAIGTAQNGQLIRRGKSLLDQILGTSLKIVETILLLQSL